MFHIAASHSTFYDFMHAGLKLKFRLAIDFSTFSLSDHNAEQSPYEDSIRALGRIMQNYDDDGKIPTYAYCNTPTNGDAEFWQMLNEKGDHEINLSELLEIYYENVDNHSFEDGPVNCSRLIESFLKEIGGGYTGEADEYHVVVLLSSGKCDDIEEIIDTMEQQAVHLPFSLIVVGVGDNSFLAWEQLGKKLKKSSIRSLVVFCVKGRNIFF